MKMLGFVVLLVATTGCVHQTTRAGTPKPGLDLWLAKECPSLPPDDDNVESLSAIGDFLIGGAINFLIDTAGSALAEAAKADREGRATSGRSASYLFEANTSNLEANGSGSDSKPPYLLPTCAVMAISNSKPRDWCHKAPFSSASLCKTKVQSTDVDGNKTTISRLESLLSAPNDMRHRHGSDAPSFYAEIELHPATDRSAFLPRLRALYYPEAVHDSRKLRSSVDRDLSLKVSAETPDGKAALGTIHVLLKDTSPKAGKLTVRSGAFDKAAPNERLDTVDSILWVSVAAPSKKLPKLDAGTRFNPINLSGEVREIGNLNKFLQALASAFDQNEEDLTKELKSRLVPGERDAAEATEELQQLANKSSIAAAIAKAYENEGKLVGACEKATSDEPDNGRSSVRQFWSLTRSAQLTVRKLEKEHRATSMETFSIDLIGTTFDNAKTARENCESGDVI